MPLTDHKSWCHRVGHTTHVEKIEESAERPKVSVVAVHRQVSFHHFNEKTSNVKMVRGTDWTPTHEMTETKRNPFVGPLSNPCISLRDKPL